MKIRILRGFRIYFSERIDFIDFVLEIPPKLELECSHTKKNKQYSGLFQLVIVCNFVILIRWVVSQWIRRLSDTRMAVILQNSKQFQ